MNLINHSFEGYTMRKEIDHTAPAAKPLTGRRWGRTYPVKTPWWFKALYPKRLWHLDRSEKKIYLSFDDGPHPVATPFVLDLLKQYNAKATFFCIGKNVVDYPGIYNRIIAEGHAVGNHTQHHLNGWKTDTKIYLDNVAAAGNFIKSKLFRPPYGRLRSAQARQLSHFRIVMWDVLSGDFDPSVSPARCSDYVLKHTNNGSVVVFHDSEKAWEKMSFVLPVVIEHFSKAGYTFSAIQEE